MADNYLKERKRRRKGVIWSVVAFVSAFVLLLISKSMIGVVELMVLTGVFTGISFVLLLVSMVRYCKI